LPPKGASGSRLSSTPCGTAAIVSLSAGSEVDLVPAEVAFRRLEVSTGIPVAIIALRIRRISGSARGAQ
jgi:hypothetical protein